MAVKMIVGPARAAADRRAPERLAENAADDAAGNGADGTGNEEAGSRAGTGADPIGPRARRGQSCDNKRRHGKDKVPHVLIPRPRLTGVPELARAARVEPNRM
jgi:hypothetical protein